MDLGKQDKKPHGLEDQSRFLRLLVKVLFVLMPVTGVVSILDIPQRLSLRFYPEQYLAIFLGLTLLAVFLSVPSNKKARFKKPPWYDVVLGFLSLAMCAYVSVNWPDIVTTGGIITWTRVILGIISIVVLLEATRRIFGWTLVLLVMAFVFYGLFTDIFPGPLGGQPMKWRRMAVSLYLDKNALFGITLQVAATIVLAFVLFGQFLLGSGGGNFLMELSLSLFGKMKGGVTKVPVVGSAIFGTISGVAVANVYTTGQITIPMMMKYGVHPQVAAAIEATASTGGLILPPVMGVAAFLIAVLLNMSYAEVCIAALLPAILFYLALYLQVDRYAASYGFGRLSPEEIPSLKKTLKENWPFFVPVFVLCYTLFATAMTAELCALYATGTTVLVRLFHKGMRSELKLQGIVSALEKTGRATAQICVVCALAGFLIGIIMLTGLGFSLTRTFIVLSGGQLSLMLVMSAALCILLGMGMPIITVYIIVAMLFVPALEQMGVPSIAAHLFVFYYGTLSFLTPPVMLSVFAAASIANASPWTTAWRALRLSISAYLVPFAFIYNPSLLLIGTFWDVLVSAAAALLGVYMLSIGLEGFLFRHLNLFQRIILIMAGAALLGPNRIILLVGAGVGAAILIWEWIAGRPKRLEGFPVPSQAPGAGGKIQEV